MAMNLVFFLLLTSAIAAVAVYILLTVGLAFVRTRGTRLVTCPETGTPAAVALASFKEAIAAPFGTPKPALSECSRWPERKACGRECLAEVVSAPDGCLVRERAAAWYADKSCVLCHRAFGAVSLGDHRPALLSPDGATVQWHEVDVVRLPELFASHRPVCWNCHVIHRVVTHRPGLVVVRPAHPDPQLPS